MYRKKCFLWPQGIKSWTRSGVEYVKIVPYRLSVWQNLWFFSWKPSWCVQIEVPLKQFLNMSDSERLRLNIKHTNYKSIPVFVNFFSNIQSPFSPLFQSPDFKDGYLWINTRFQTLTFKRWEFWLRESVGQWNSRHIVNTVSGESFDQ